MRILLYILILLLGSQSANAQTRIVSEKADQTALTIYPDNLALVTETRTINVPAGRSVIAFKGVSDLIIPQSLVLREFSGLTLERNFDYDLLSKGSLFESAIGETVTLTRIDERSGAVSVDQAEIVSAGPQTYTRNEWGGQQLGRESTGVVFKIDDKFEAFNCSGLAHRVQFDQLPNALNPFPVMSIEVSAKTASKQEVVISYLTSGIGWEADYRVDLKPQNKANMLGWLTLTNDTNKNYQDVPLAVIAGDLNRSPETQSVEPLPKELFASCWTKGSSKLGIPVNLNTSGGRNDGKVTFWDGSVGYAHEAPMQPVMMEAYSSDEIVVTGSRIAKEEKFGDYKLYRIPDNVTVAPHQTKQIAFLNTQDITVDPYFEWDPGYMNSRSRPQALQTAYDVDNARDGALSKSLPTGTIRLFQQTSSGKTFFIGEDQIDNKAVDEDVNLTIGNSASVFMTTEFEDDTDKDGNLLAFVRHRITNANNYPVRVKIINSDPRFSSRKIKTESLSRDPDELVPTWWLNVPAEDSVVLEYSIGVEYTYYYDLEPLVGFDSDLSTADFDDVDVALARLVEGTSERIPLDLDSDEVGSADGPITVGTLIGNISETEDGDEVITRATVRHRIRNRSDKAQTLWLTPEYYDEMEPGDADVIESSIEPVFKGLPVWKLVLEPGSVTDMSYTIEGRY